MNVGQGVGERKRRVERQREGRETLLSSNVLPPATGLGEGSHQGV